MRTIYLSPHLDDAVLSGGDLIHNQCSRGCDVEVWTLMAGLPPSEEMSEFAKEMHRKWGTRTISETLERRRAEDRRALDCLGAKAVHFGFLDAIYRRGPHGAYLYGEPVGAAISPGDADLSRAMAAGISARLAPDDVIICQLAVGGHVDHVLAREAAEQLGRPLVYIADMPYALRHPEEVAFRAAGLELTKVPLLDDDLEAWIGAIPAYASQITSIYESWELLEADLRNYWSRERGIEAWYTHRPLPHPGLDSAPNS